ncbi:hypothetical protein JHK85_024857 [Glycine max]|nr:hypothetical protein JHK85_024857 [Glycine max]
MKRGPWLNSTTASDPPVQTHMMVLWDTFGYGTSHVNEIEIMSSNWVVAIGTDTLNCALRAAYNNPERAIDYSYFESLKQQKLLCQPFPHWSARTTWVDVDALDGIDEEDASPHVHMNSVFSINTTAHVALFRALHRAPQCALLCHNLKCLVTFYNSSSNYCRIPCSFGFVPSPSSLRSVRGLLLRTLRCISSFTASFASPAGGGNGSAGTGDSGRGDDSGSESGDANLKLVGDATQELSGLSPNVINLDVLV